MAKGGLFSQFSWTASGTFVAAAVNLITLIVFSRSLGPSEYGRFALAHAGTEMILSVLFRWINASITRMSVEQGKNLALFRGAVLVGFIIASILAFIVTGVAVGIANLAGYKDILHLSFLAAIAAIAEALTLRNLEHYRAFSRSMPYATVLVSRAVLILSFAWVGFMYFGETAEVAMCGYAIGCMVTFMASEIIFWEPSKIDKSCHGYLVEMFRFGGPISTSNIFRILTRRVDRFLLGIFFGTEAVGYYALAFDFVHRAISIPLMVVNTVTYPAIVNAWRNQNNTELERLTLLNWRGLVLLGVPAVIGLSMISDDIITNFFSDSFSVESIPLIMSIAGLCMFMEAVRFFHLDVAFLLKRETKTQLLICIVGFGINVIACFALIPFFHTVGAAIAALITVLLIAFLSMKLSQKHFHMPIPSGPVVGALICVLPMGIALKLLGKADDIVSLALHIGIAIFIFVGSVLVLNIDNMRTLLLGVIQKNRDGT